MLNATMTTKQAEILYDMLGIPPEKRYNSKLLLDIVDDSQESLYDNIFDVDNPSYLSHCSNNIVTSERDLVAKLDQSELSLAMGNTKTLQQIQTKIKATIDKYKQGE